MFRVRLLLVAFFLHPTLFVFGSSAVRGAARCSSATRENMMENWSFRVNKTKSNMWQEGESRTHTHTQSSEERLPSIQTDRRDLMKNPHAMHVFNSLIELHQGSRSLSEFAPSLGRSRIYIFYVPMLVVRRRRRERKQLTIIIPAKCVCVDVVRLYPQQTAPRLAEKEPKLN